jgi:hypothetical protein
MEQEIRKAARQVIAKMARLAAEDEPATAAHYQSMLAQLALAQVALAYPHASLGTCMEHGMPLHFRAQADGLYVCCTESATEHGWKIA